MMDYYLPWRLDARRKESARWDKWVYKSCEQDGWVSCVCVVTTVFTQDFIIITTSTTGAVYIRKVHIRATGGENLGKAFEVAALADQCSCVFFICLSYKPLTSLKAWGATVFNNTPFCCKANSDFKVINSWNELWTSLTSLKTVKYVFLSPIRDCIQKFPDWVD